MMFEGLGMGRGGGLELKAAQWRTESQPQGPRKDPKELELVPVGSETILGGLKMRKTLGGYSVSPAGSGTLQGLFPQPGQGFRHKPTLHGHSEPWCP